MTEEEFLAGSRNLHDMIWTLQQLLTDRKNRLFIAACCRRVWHLLPDGRSRHAIEVAERFADGEIDDTLREAAKRGAAAAMLEGKKDADGDDSWASRGMLVQLAVWNEISITRPC